jgi:hypothetical protein
MNKFSQTLNFSFLTTFWIEYIGCLLEEQKIFFVYAYAHGARPLSGK